MLAQRVCRRDQLPRRLDRIYGRGPQLAWGKESAPCRGRSGFWKGERASEGRGCFERGTLNADKKGKPEGSRTVQRLSLMARVAKECGKKSGVESQIYDLSRQGRKDFRFRIAAYWGLEQFSIVK